VAVKSILTEEEFAKLSDDRKADYQKQDDGTHVLQLDLDNHPGMKGLAKKNRELLSEKKKVEDLFEPFKDIGLTVEQINEAVQKAAGAKGGDPAALEALKKQLTGEHEKVTKGKDTEIESLTAQLSEVLGSESLIKALAEHSDTPDLIVPHVLRSLKTTKGENGKLTVKVVDKDGNDRIADAQGTPMSLKQLAAEIAADKRFAPLIRGNDSSGSGAPPKNPPPGVEAPPRRPSRSWRAPSARGRPSNPPGRTLWH
jgi:hypothetical protein